MPIMVPAPAPKPVTVDESTRVLELVRKHASPSAWKTLASSLNAKPNPYPYPVK